MKAINIGKRYEIYDDTLKVYNQLPAKTYTICFEKMSGFYLAEHTDIAVTEKIYGVHEEKANKVLRSFAAFERSLGVILSGNKGIGKSLFAKRLCEKAVAAGYPVLVLDQFIPGVASYLESIDQEVVVLFDEFDKTFGSIRVGENEADPQAGLLSLFDGVACGKKLFVITCNELRGLNDYLVNRPGRFHYHFRFEYPSDAEIREYLTDKLDERYHSEIDKVIGFARRVNLNFDCLRAIAFELNSGDPFESAIQDLNILNLQKEKYRVTLHFTDGTSLTNRKCYIDLFDGDAEYDIELFDKQNENICDVKFSMENAVYDSARGTTVVAGDECRLRFWDEDKEESPYRKKKINYLSIVHIYDRSLHYSAAY